MGTASRDHSWISPSGGRSTTRMAVASQFAGDAEVRGRRAAGDPEAWPAADLGRRRSIPSRSDAGFSDAPLQPAATAGRTDVAGTARRPGRPRTGRGTQSTGARQTARLPESFGTPLTNPGKSLISTRSRGIPRLRRGKRGIVHPCRSHCCSVVPEVRTTVQPGLQPRRSPSCPSPDAGGAPRPYPRASAGAELESRWARRPAESVGVETAADAFATVVSIR